MLRPYKRRSLRDASAARELFGECGGTVEGFGGGGEVLGETFIRGLGDLFEGGVAVHELEEVEVGLTFVGEGGRKVGGVGAEMARGETGAVEGGLAEVDLA